MSVIWKDGQYLNGVLPQVFHDDAGFINGLAVFDSMMAVDGVLVDAGEHYERLIHDVGVVLGIGSSWLPAFAGMTEVWLPLLSENDMHRGHARVKTIVTGGLSAKPLGVSDIPTIVVSVAPAAPPEPSIPMTAAIVRDFPRIAGSVLENCKRIDYTRSYAARRQAQGRGAEEAIITNTEGNIACGATSNLFIEENGHMITPPLRDGVLAGVIRRKMLETGQAMEASIPEERLRAASKIYLTNSFIGMRPVTLI